MKMFFIFCFSLVLNFTFAQHDASEMCRKSKIEKLNYVFNQKQTVNQGNFDIFYLKFDLDISPTAKKIDGIAEVHCKSLINGLDLIQLDLTSSLSVQSVKINDEFLSFNHSSDLLSINLDKPYNIGGENIILTIVYSGLPANSFHFDTKDGLPMIWTKTEPYGSKDWIPCKNLPDDKADSLDLIITVPSDLIVASNGVLINTEIIGNKTTYYWKERYPIVSYLISLAIHPYRIRTDYFYHGNNDSMPIVNYIIPSQFDNNNEKYGLVPDILEAFTGYFGEYPFINEKYGNAEFLWGGGMEHQTLTSLSGPYEFLLAHELAHQWWGDMITCKDFHHIWLNEGFATYSEALWEESKGGLSALHSKMDEKKYLGKGTVYVEDITNSGVIFDGNLSYKKGAWVLHMLRHVVGDSTFFEILKAYSNSGKKYNVATTEDFKQICEQVSNKDLSAFFDQWIYGDFHPVYLYDWGYTEESGNYILTLDIEQFQVENLFYMPIDIHVTTESGEEMFVVENDRKIQSYSFTLNSKPTSVQLDKDNWILKEVIEGINIINHDNNDLILSLSSEGSLGHDKPDGFGNGMIYPRDGQNTLFYGSFMFGNNDNYVVDNSEKGGNKDFQKKSGTKIEINNTTISNLDVNIKYSDLGHPQSNNIDVEQTSYSWTLDPYRDFILFNYNITNNGSTDLDELYVAQFLDFDIGDFSENYIKKDESRKLIFQYNDNIYTGIRLLNNTIDINYCGILDAVDNLNENLKYQYLCGKKNNFKQNQKGDWSSLLSTGPYNLIAGENLDISFAIVGGISENDLKANSDYAQSLFDKYIVNTDDLISENEKKIAFVNVVPNPIVDKINLEIFSLDSQNSRVEVFDVNGVKLYSVDKFLTNGNNNITIIKSPKPGIYFYKVTIGKNVYTGKIIK